MGLNPAGGKMKKTSAFTLIELLVVIAIIALLLAKRLRPQHYVSNEHAVIGTGDQSLCR